MNYLAPNATPGQLQALSALGLAHIGDGVFELMVRTYLCTTGYSASKNLHRAAVAMVNAPAQHAFLDRIFPLLTADEVAVYKRGRNAKVNSVPQNATEADYHAATGLETLLGWLYLSGKPERVNELFQAGLPNA